MLGTGHSLRHLAYFEELASMEESDVAWRSVSAGLVVLRLVDSWMYQGPHVVSTEAFGLRAVRAAVDEMSSGDPARSILSSVLDSMQRASAVKMHAIAPPLLAYARALEYEARWSLAADVYQTVVAQVHPSVDSEYAIDGQIRLGACLRNLGEIDGAAEAYRVAGQVATAARDMVGVLRSRIGEAKVAIARGNMPSAEAILDETIAQAGGKALRSVRSMALHDRAHIAHVRGDYDQAVQLAYSALHDSESPRERDRILGDIASAFVELGVFSAAEDAYLILSATAQEVYLRWLATINLMDLATKTGAEPVFERRRQDLEDANLPPLLKGYFELYSGQGHQRFGQRALAVECLERAVRTATEFKLNQLLFEAEESLQSARADRVPTRAPLLGTASSATTDVATALREMRGSVVSQT